jgi:CTP synthase
LLWHANGSSGYARNVKGLSGANSTEIDENTSHPVIDIMEEQKNISEMGGTMRLGAWKCTLEEGSLVHSIYKNTSIAERHRHRYEFNSDYNDALFDADFKLAGKNPETQLVEIVENAAHPWFVGVQFHPEYKSTVAQPHPLFVAFVGAALKHHQNKK